jgi:nitroreductase
MNESIEYIFKRRSIRNYKPQEVEKEKLLLLLQAAMAAPNAANMQPWEFIIVTDVDILSQLRDNLWAGRYNAPAMIVVCGNTTHVNNQIGWSYWPQDCAAATENILIAAVSLGLGTVWIGAYPNPSVVKPVTKILNLPENIVPLSLIWVGYPAEEKPPRTQYDEHRVHWQQYEPRKKRMEKKNPKYLP